MSFLHCNSTDSEDFIAGRLTATLKKIDGREETWNPFKAFSRYRRNRLFVAATKKFNRRVKVARMTYTFYLTDQYRRPLRR